MIQEIILTTLNSDGSTHIAPMGIQQQQDRIVIAPFKPSTTLDNIVRNRTAVVNRTDDVRIFAGCLVGHRDWPLCHAKKIPTQRLQAALNHLELELEDYQADQLRPRCYCKIIHEETHAPFTGFNRAQASVLEAAILASRLDRLTVDKITTELDYLQIAIDKTAGEKERQAWTWLMDYIQSSINR